MSVTGKLFLAIQIILLALVGLHGQSDLRFENYYIEDGLPHSRASVIHQDKLGWIWIGTEGGLSRYDGTSFESFLLGNESEEEPSSHVYCMWEDQDSILWIGTVNNGMFRFDWRQNQFTQFSHHDTSDNCLSSNQVYSITGDLSGTMWIGTDRGLNRYDPHTGSFQMIRPAEGYPGKLSSDTIHKLFIDRDERIWIGTFRGLDYMDPGSDHIVNFPLYEDRETVPEGGIRFEDISQDASGLIMLGTYLHGLFVVNPADSEVKNIIPDPDYRRSYTVRSVYPGLNDDLWVGTRGGIYVLDREYRITRHYKNSLQDENSLGHNSVNDIYKDRVGDIWVAHRNGLSYVNPQSMAFHYYSASVENDRYLNDPEVYAICQSRDGSLWLGTENGGVNILNRNTGRFDYLTHDEYNPNTVCSNCIKSIIQDNRGNFWIGTFLGGLDYYDMKRKRFTHYVNDPDDSNSLLNNTVWALHEDRSGRIWIGTDLGLDRYDPAGQKFTHIDIGRHNYPVHAIFEDRKGNLYFGSSLGTMVVIQPDLGKVAFDVAARIIFEDGQGRIWIGSDGNEGLMQFTLEDGVIRSYKTSHGLPSNQVLGILEDNQGRLWISTVNGLARFDPETETFRTYRKEDGIQGDRFYYGSSLMTDTGELLFGGQHGLTEFNPDQLSENLDFPPVVITDLKIFNKKVPVGTPFEGELILPESILASKKITVDYQHSVLTFDYTALNYSNSSKIQYAYMLEGFDKEWNYVGPNRSATYTNLDPGSYVFKVRSSNNNGIWNDHPASIEMVVTPPFTKTVGFRILLLLSISTIIYFIVVFILRREKLKNQLVLERMKSKELHKIDMMKFQFFTNISHEIRTPISLIVSPLSRIKSNSMSREQIMKDIDIVHRNALRLGKLVDQLLDFRKLEAGKLKLELARGNIVTFLENINDMFKEMSAEKQIQLNFFSALDQVQIYFDPDKIEKVMFNLLSNAFKHTSPGGTINVTVSLTYLTSQELETEDEGHSGEYVQIAVRDTGCGIDDGRKEHIFDRFYQGKSSEKNVYTGTGIGLSLSRELIKLHQGRIFVKSQVGIGTEITIQFPVIKADPESQDQQPAEVLQHQEPDESSPPASARSSEELVDSSTPVLLIMEDNTELLNFIQSIFSEEYTVLVAEDGEAGLEMAKETIPDLVISDVLMPKLDGVKVCKKLKNDFRTSHIPVILLTALTSKEHEKEGILGGADEYITKPFDPALLKIKVDQLLATRRLLREKYSREYLMQDNTTGEVPGSPDDKFMAKLVAAIEENISDPEFGTVKISREVGVSRTQLYRKMAALTEMTVKEFIRSIRLKRAAQLLVQGELNISEVAYAVGFQQAAYFRKCFKEMYGMTPSEYGKSKVMHP